MTVSEKIRILLLAAAAIPAFSANALADGAPQPVQEGDIAYVSGGIGIGEQDAIKAESKDYNLQMTNANEKGHYTIVSHLVLLSKDGGELVKADNIGPLFYAKLPPGTYTIDAVIGNQHERQNVTVSGGKAKPVHFVWHDKT